MTFGIALFTMKDDVTSVTSTEMNALDANQALAIDGAGGGTYTPSSNLEITDGSGGSIGDLKVTARLRFQSGTNPRMTFKRGTTIADTDSQTLSVASGQFIDITDATGLRQHFLSNTLAQAGDFITLRHSSGGGSNVEFYKDGGTVGVAADRIVTLVGGSHCTATVYHDGTDWRLGLYSPNVLTGLAS